MKSNDSSVAEQFFNKLLVLIGQNALLVYGTDSSGWQVFGAVFLALIAMKG